MSKVVAIARAVGSSLADCELNFLAREPIDLAEANRQHAAYCDALRRAGISVEVLSAAQHLPDAVFVEDTAVEPFAANSLVLNGVVHLSCRWGRTRDLLEQRGFRTSVLTISEFEKAEAGLTCLSLVFRGEMDGESEA